MTELSDYFNTSSESLSRDALSETRSHQSLSPMQGYDFSSDLALSNRPSDLSAYESRRFAWRFKVGKLEDILLRALSLWTRPIANDKAEKRLRHVSPKPCWILRNLTTNLDDCQINVCSSWLAFLLDRVHCTDGGLFYSLQGWV